MTKRTDAPEWVKEYFREHIMPKDPMTIIQEQREEIKRLKAMPSEERVRRLRDHVESVIDDDVKKLQAVAEAAVWLWNLREKMTWIMGSVMEMRVKSIIQDHLGPRLKAAGMLEDGKEV